MMALSWPSMYAGGSVGDLPGLGEGGLVEIGEAGDDGAQALGVVEEGDGAVGVDGGVVPGGDDAVGLVLGGIPVGGDVGVGARDDQEGFGGGVGVLPLEVGAGDVAEEGAEGAALFVEKDWEVGGDEARGGEGDERGEGVALDVGVEGGEVVDEEVFGGVHEGTGGCWVDDTWEGAFSF